MVDSEGPGSQVIGCKVELEGGSEGDSEISNTSSK